MGEWEIHNGRKFSFNAAKDLKGGNILFYTILFWPLRSVYITWVLVQAQKMHNDLTEKRQLLSVLSKPNSLNWKFGKHLLAFAWNQYWLVGFVNICITQCCNHSQVFTVQCTLKENSILLLSLYYSMYLSLYLFLFLYLSLYPPCVSFSAATVHGRSVHPVRDLDFTMAGEKSNLCSFTQYWWIDWLIYTKLTKAILDQLIWLGRFIW